MEDDVAIGQALQSHLTAHHHQVLWATTAADAIIEAADARFDLVLLDLGLPDLDGFDVCRQIRVTQPSCVLVILTASNAEIDVVVGLEAGADDYLTKPFRLAELVARIRAHLRRNTAAQAPSQVTRLGNLELDAAARRVRLDGHDLTLRAKEFDVLARLVSESEVAVSRAALIADVWGDDWSGSDKNLDVTISALRRRLGHAARKLRTGTPEIVTLRGRGYRLQSPVG